MGKKLSEMTLEELWQLFPIFLTPPKKEWAARYAEQAASLRKILPGAVLYHVGSTAINGIWAKDIVDIIAELAPGSDMDEACRMIIASGWILMSRSIDRMSFNMGYTENGFAEKVYHLHLRRKGDIDEVYFSDYLNANPEVAIEYEALKLSLWKNYEHDHDGYTNAKTEFVQKYTRMAKVSFEYMPNEDFSIYARQLFDMLYDNMADIAPFSGSREDEFTDWYNAVSSGLTKPARRIVLIKYSDNIVGFFQYYTNDTTFMMEEIQILPEYRTAYGIFRSLYSFLMPQLPETLLHVKAYAHVQNTKSDAILRRMGLAPTAGTAPDNIVSYCGDFSNFIEWHEKGRS